MKKCPFCAEDIQDAAVVCKHCGRDLSNAGAATASTVTVPAVDASAKKSGGCMKAILFVVGGGILLSVIGRMIPKSAEDVSAGQRTDAAQVCKQFVEKRLRAPATADFQNIYDATVSGPLGGVEDYEVTSYVDSENGFGAKIRSSYICKVEHRDGKNWHLLDLKIDGK